MKYYLDTEFHEYQRKPLFSKPFRTIELISIGIVAEDGREYYAVSKDFDLKAAWNSYQIKDTMPDSIAFGKRKEYWLRDNVLRPVADDLVSDNDEEFTNFFAEDLNERFFYRELKRLLDKYGKSNSQIAEEVKKFTLHKEVLFEKNKYPGDYNDGSVGVIVDKERGIGRTLNKGQFEWVNPEFYAYYADYDWVVFCWLFGKMIDLPKGFPMYCRDLKQMLDEKNVILREQGVSDIYTVAFEAKMFYSSDDMEESYYRYQDHRDYPKQSNEHNALADAKWNKELHEFIEKL